MTEQEQRRGIVTQYWWDSDQSRWRGELVHARCATRDGADCEPVPLFTVAYYSCAVCGEPFAVEVTNSDRMEQ